MRFKHKLEPEAIKSFTLLAMLLHNDIRRQPRYFYFILIAHNLWFSKALAGCDARSSELLSKNCSLRRYLWTQVRNQLIKITSVWCTHLSATIPLAVSINTASKQQTKAKYGTQRSDLIKNLSQKSTWNERRDTLEISVVCDDTS